MQLVFNVNYLVFTVGGDVIITPHRGGPAGICGETGDVVNVQLRYDIAQCCNIKFICFKDLLKALAEKHGFCHKLLLVSFAQLVHFSDTMAIRQQDKPGIMAVVQ